MVIFIPQKGPTFSPCTKSWNRHTFKIKLYVLLAKLYKSGS
jgi:hypothetical protein